MLTESPEWCRSCADCRKYVIGPSGAVSTYMGPDGKGGAVELPMLRAMYPGADPPCHVCPKPAAMGVPDPRPLGEDEDFAPWMVDARRWFLTCRAVGRFPESLSPSGEAVARLCDRWERAGERAELADAVAGAVASVVRRKP